MTPNYDDDNFLGSEDDLQDAAGDELDLAQTVKNLNPIADQLQHFADLRGTKHALLNAQAPFSRINPPSVLTGSLGTQVSVSAGELKQVAAWAGDDAETGPVTITLAAVAQLDAMGDDYGYAAHRPYAVIQFGTRASLLTAEVDISRGCQLTVCASMVTVQVGTSYGPIDNAAALPKPILLSGMLSFHPMVRTQNVTRTTFIDTNVLIGIGVVPTIPAFARSVTLLKTSNTEIAKAGDLVFYTSSTSESVTIPIAGGTQLLTPIPIPDDAVNYSFTTGAPGFISIKHRAIFNLGI